MVDRDTPRRETISGLPYITAAELEAFNGKTRDFYQDFEDLKKENPELAYDLISGITGADPNFLKTRRHMAIGALRLYMLLKDKAILNTLDDIAKADSRESHPISDDGVGDADPQPLA